MALKFSKLTRPKIRLIKQGQKVAEHGITVEHLRDGDLRYSVNIMVDGERIHRVIGKQSEGMTRTQCEKFIERVRTEAREGRLSLSKGRKLHLTFADAFQKYVQRLEETGGKNIKAKRRHLKHYLCPFLGNQRLDAVTSFTVDRYKKRRQETGAADGTINRELATLSHLFNRATEWKWIKSPPCRIVMLPESAGRIVALSGSEAQALLRAAMEDEDTYCWLFVMFGLNTAMRHSEILRTRFDQLDLDGLRLFIPEAKGGMREQPITPELAEMLRKERDTSDDPDGSIFPSPRPGASTTGHRHRMDKPFRRAVKRAGLDPSQVTPHVMRHTAITKLVEAGVDLPTIQRISGHKTLAMVLRYTHVHGSHIDKAMKTIGCGLPEQSGNRDTQEPSNLRTVGEQSG